MCRCVQNRPLFFMTLRLRCCCFPPQPHWTRTLQKAHAPESRFKNQKEFKERRETTKYKNTEQNTTEPKLVFSLSIYVIFLLPQPPLTTYVVVLGSSFNWRTTKVPATVPMVYFFITDRVFLNSVWSNILFKLLVLLFISFLFWSCCSFIMILFLGTELYCELRVLFGVLKISHLFYIENSKMKFSQDLSCNLLPLFLKRWSCIKGISDLLHIHA